MKKTHLAVLVACAFAGRTPLQARPADDSGEAVVVVTKHAQAGSKTGSAYSRIDGEELERTQKVNLQQALGTTPGVLATNAGAFGGTPIFSIRGNRSDHTLYVVDGIRINTGINPDAKSFLAYAGTDGIGSIEIARGPQSTLYGSEGIGGVVAIETMRGDGEPEVAVFGEGGSFYSFREGIRSNGAVGKAAYSVFYERVDSDNNRPNNDLAIDRYAMRLDYQPTDELKLRLNFRGHVGEFQEPGSSRPQDFASNDPAARAQGESNLVSFMADWNATRQWTQKLTLGAYFERYFFEDPPYSGNFFTPTLYISDAANYSLDWLHSVQIARNNRISAGFALNLFTGHDNSFPDKSSTNWAFYLQDEWEPFKNLNLTGGFRYDDYELAGGALTFRFTGAYMVAKTDTKIRASYGTAFKVPSFFQTFSTSPFALGNPELRPETSCGWDVGVDQYLLGSRLVLSASYFRNDIRDLIAFVPTGAFTGSYLNRDTAKNDGVELALQAKLFDHWITRVAYTWTESTFTSSGISQRRDDIPRHQLGVDTSYLFGGRWLVGCGVTFAAGRQDTDFSTFPSSKTMLADYATLRVYSRYKVNDHLSFFARGENITNTRYENKLGYPALPVGFYGGLELRF
jgi:vitamin B12 transporter